MTPDQWREKLAEDAARARLAQRRAVPRHRGAPPLQSIVTKALAPILREAGPAPGSLQARWPEIVGPAIAKVTSPLRVSSGRTGATLHLAAPSAAAPMLQHAAAHIIERVNLATGANVKHLKIIHSGVPKAHPSKPKRQTLSPLEKAAIVRDLADLKTPALRDALAKLGEAMAVSRKPPEK